MSQSIGAALRTGRERRQLTLAQVSEATRIRAHYIQALENDDLSAMTSAAQARGFMRIYAEFLALDLEALIPPAASAAAAPADAPALPRDESSVSPEVPAPEGAPAGLLASLRARMIRRLRATKSPTTESPAPADFTPEPASDDKKKAFR